MASSTVLRKGVISIDTFKIGIVGAGPIGSILAAHLVKNDHKTIVCDIDEPHLRAMQSSGLEISGYCQMVVKIPDVCTDLGGMKEENVDILFLAVKTPVLEQIIPRIKEIFHEGMLLVSCQNGLGNEEFLASHFGEKNVARVIVNYAGNLIGPGKIRMSFFTGTNYIGAIHQETDIQCVKVAQLLSEAGLETKFTKELKTYEWEKAILNCVLAPISAITGLTMKDVMDGESTRLLVEGTCRECIQVARTAGIKLKDNFFEFCMAYLEKAGLHKPSMLIDVECKRRTEIGFLNQKICEFGKKLGIDTPFNTMLTTLVNGIDKCCEIELDRMKKPGNAGKNRNKN